MKNDEDYDENYEARCSNLDEATPVDELSTEILITRLADGDASDAEWNEFQRRAAADHAPWRRLAEEQHTVRKLREGFERVTVRLDQIGLAVACSESAYASGGVAKPGRPANRGYQFVVHLVRQYGGWVAAAAVALVWTISTVTLPNRHGSSGLARTAGDIRDHGANIANSSPNAVPVNMTPDQYYEKYLESPYVVRELQPLLLQTGRNQDGQPEVLYMRRIIERRKFDGVYRVATDGYSNGVLLPGSPPGASSPNSKMY